jgi:hypothetical protein
LAGTRCVAAPLGVAILANSRPFKGLVICIPVMAILFWWLCSKKRPPWKAVSPRLYLPFVSAMLLCGVFMGYYNWRLTGRPLLFPEVLHYRTYSVPTVFVWQKPAPPSTIGIRNSKLSITDGLAGTRLRTAWMV